MTKAYHAEVIENVRICPWPDPYDDREHPNERPEQRKSLSHEAGFSGPEWMQPTEAKSDIERTGQHGFRDSSLSMPIPVDPHSRMDKCAMRNTTASQNSSNRIDEILLPPFMDAFYSPIHCSRSIP